MKKEKPKKYRNRSDKKIDLSKIATFSKPNFYNKRLILIYTVLGFSLFILRMLSINFYYQHNQEYQLFFVSNFIALITAFALILQLRVQLLNSIIISVLPITLFTTFFDFYYVYIGIYQFNLNRVTLHLPSFILGMFLLFDLKRFTNLISFLAGFFILIIWIIIADFRLVFFFEDTLIFIGICIFVSYNLLFWYYLVRVDK